MTKVTIFGRGLDSQEVEAVQALLVDVEVCKGPVEVVEAIRGSPPDYVDSAVIVLGSSNTCSDSLLEADLANALKSAQRVVWIWPDGSTQSNLPPSAKKYCYSVVPWDAKKLNSVLADDDVTRFEKSSGVPLDKVKTERNLCVDDSADEPQ